MNGQERTNKNGETQTTEELSAFSSADLTKTDEAISALAGIILRSGCGLNRTRRLRNRFSTKRKAFAIPRRTKEFGDKIYCVCGNRACGNVFRSNFSCVRTIVRQNILRQSYNDFLLRMQRDFLDSVYCGFI